MRAFPLADGAALVHLHNVSGGLLGGDQLGLEVEVGPGAAAQLTTTGSTRLYRSRGDHLCAMQRTNVRVGEEGLLEYVPDPLIPFAGSKIQAGDSHRACRRSRTLLVGSNIART